MPDLEALIEIRNQVASQFIGWRIRLQHLHQPSESADPHKPRWPNQQPRF